MAKPHERVFALVAAVLFLASSVGVSIFVIWQFQQEKKAKTDQAALDKATNQALQTNKPEANKLEGTKLQGFTPLTSVDKLSFTDTVVGTGETVKEGATVTAHYTGAYVLNGVIFQSSHDRGQPIPFSLSEVIPGWTQGVPGMKVGGTRRLVIPGNLAYGDAPAGYQPGDGGNPLGPLVFDIEITAVKNP